MKNKEPKFKRGDFVNFEMFGETRTGVVGNPRKKERNYGSGGFSYEYPVRCQGSTVYLKEHQLKEDEKTTRIELTGEEILSAIRRFKNIPDHATVQFHIPGGGDWSNTKLDIDSEHPIVIDWGQE